MIKILDKYFHGYFNKLEDRSLKREEKYFLKNKQLENNNDA